MTDGNFFTEYFSTKNFCETRVKMINSSAVVKQITWFLDRAVFSRVSKIISIFFGFALLYFVIGLKKSCQLLIQSKILLIQNQVWLTHACFPPRRVGYM